MTREELLAMEGMKVALTTQHGDNKTAYHGVLLKVAASGVVMGMGTYNTPTPLHLDVITVCVPFADQNTSKKGHRS